MFHTFTFDHSPSFPRARLKRPATAKEGFPNSSRTSSSYPSLWKLRDSNATEARFKFEPKGYKSMLNHVETQAKKHDHPPHPTCAKHNIISIDINCISKPRVEILLHKSTNKKSCAPTRAVFDPVAQPSIALNEEQILDPIEI